MVCFGIHTICTRILNLETKSINDGIYLVLGREQLLHPLDEVRVREEGSHGVGGHPHRQVDGGAGRLRGALQGFSSRASGSLTRARPGSLILPGYPIML